MNMLSLLRPASMMLLLLTVITGVIYPLAVTGMAQAVFPAQANGSIMIVDGRATGSRLIGQPFDDPAYFWARPSATLPYAYNAAASSGSNFGPTNPDLLTAVDARMAALRAADPTNRRPVPVDLVTASASGLDPHISPAAAAYQVARVAAARGLDVAAVQALVTQHTEGGILWGQLRGLGEPGVNVLSLNLALDALSGSIE